MVVGDPISCNVSIASSIERPARPPSTSVEDEILHGACVREMHASERRIEGAGLVRPAWSCFDLQW
jgi:hypothetical protein